MRILLLAPGHVVHTERFARQLLLAGHKVTLLDPVNPDLGEFQHYRFIPYHPTPLRGERFRIIRELGRLIRIRQIRRIATLENPDLIHVHWIDSRAALCAQAGGYPLVLTAWGSDINRLFDEASPPPTRDLLEVVAALHQADLVTADSSETLGRCRHLAGIDLNTCIYHFGVDAARFLEDKPGDAAQLKRRLGIDPSMKVVLNARRIHPSLCPFEVVEGFAFALRQQPDACLVLRSYNSLSPAYEDSVRERIRTLGLSPRVFWLNSASYEEVPLHYAIADVVVNYAQMDAFPVSLIEAALSRRPIVTSDLPVYDEVFQSEVTKVPLNSPELLGRAVAAALQASEEGNALRVSAAARIAESIGSDTANMSRLLQEYEGIARGRSQGSGPTATSAKRAPSGIAG